MSATLAPPRRVEIRPQRGPQEKFLSTPADIAIFGGSAGGGKTFAILLEPLRHVGKRGFTAVVFRRTYPQITRAGGMWQASTELYHALGGRARETTMEWVFPAGARIEFAHMQHDADRFSWTGSEIALIEFDQLEEFSAEQFWYLVSRNRSTSGVRPYIRATCNPVPQDDATGGWLHALIAWWIGEDGYPIAERAGVIRWFVRDPETDEYAWADDPATLRATHGADVQPKSVTFVPAVLADNVILEAKDPGYRSNLMALPRVERLRLLGGNWHVRPTAGAVFDRAWFEIMAAAPVDARRMRFWDKAGTAGAGDWSAGVRLAYTPERLWVVEDVVRGQWSSLERNRVMRQVAASDGTGVAIEIEQEPGSGGKESAELSVRELAGYDVRARVATGDLLVRSGPFAAQCEARNVRLVRGAWNEAYLRELHGFPDDAHDDQVSASAGAFNRLALWGAGDAPLLSVLGAPRTNGDAHGAAVKELESIVAREGFYWPSNGR